MGRFLAAALLPAVLVLGGCGGSSGEETPKELTVPAYGQFPAMTVPVTRGSPAYCRAKADAFSRAAADFLRPFPSDADNYRVLARVQFIAFEAHLCDTAVLRAALSRRLTLEQRREVISYFGFLGETAHELVQASED